MERDGLIERVADPDDRRRARIHLSRHARQLQPRLVKAGHHVNARATEGLQPDELAAFMKTLAQLIENLQTGP
jgi:MarR family transcriptional regulator for hemolysin